jgi:hypothetical protein
MNQILDDPQVLADLRGRLKRQLDSALAIRAGVPSTRNEGMAAELADRYHSCLRGTQGRHGGEEAAQLLMDNLISLAEMDSAAFWATPLGRALAWWTGGNRPGMARSAAQAALGVTRQAVAQLVGGQRLSTLTLHHGVTRESLRDLMQQRHPLSGGE